MRRVFFFFIGLFTASLAEFWRFYIVSKKPAPWLPLLIGYFLFLLLAYFAMKKIKSGFIYYIVFGIVGLIIEIILLAQLPSIISAGFIGWLAWFSFWGSVALIPRLYLLRELKMTTTIFFFSSLVFFLCFQFVTGNIGLMGLFYLSLNIPYIWQFKK